LYAELARSSPGAERQQTLELPAGSSVQDLLTSLALPSERGVIVGLNGKLADRSAALSDGDELELMTAMEGGYQGARSRESGAGDRSFPGS
jgi:sulfur carrier protein ThiS